MRRTTIGTLAAATLALTGCGSSTTFANKPRPAVPVDLTVYINNARVSVSPSSVGAGSVIFIVTNQSSRAQRLTIVPAGPSATQPLADTGPVNPQATTQVTVDFQPGDYTVTTGGSGATDATVATASPIQPAALHIGQARPNSNGVLLQP